MPNRIIKESICRSEEIDSLTWFEEVLFYRLIVVCDDFGIYDGRTKIIKASCFPLKNVTEKDIGKALNKLSAVGLVRVYETQGRPYLQLVTWANHQSIRNQKSKYPVYTEDCRLLEFDGGCGKSKNTEGDCKQLKSIESNCIQLKSIEYNCARNPIQSESESESNHNICSELRAAAEPVTPTVITLQLNTGEEYPITQEDVDGWAELYPAVDILQELRKMKGWCMDNPRKRKTRSGIRRFVGSWLSKEQDRGGLPKSGQNYGQGMAKRPGGTFFQFDQRTDYPMDKLEKKLNEA